MTPLHLFTREAWASLTPGQRTLVGIYRRRAVLWAQLEHDRRYHSAENFGVLERALDEGKTNAPNGP